MHWEGYGTAHLRATGGKGCWVGQDRGGAARRDYCGVAQPGRWIVGCGLLGAWRTFQSPVQPSAAQGTRAAQATDLAVRYADACNRQPRTQTQNGCSRQQLMQQHGLVGGRRRPRRQGQGEGARPQAGRLGWPGRTAAGWTGCCTQLSCCMPSWGAGARASGPCRGTCQHQGAASIRVDPMCTRGHVGARRPLRTGSRQGGGQAAAGVAGAVCRCDAAERVWLGLTLCYSGDAAVPWPGLGPQAGVAAVAAVVGCRGGHLGEQGRQRQRQAVPMRAYGTGRGCSVQRGGKGCQCGAFLGRSAGLAWWHALELHSPFLPYPSMQARRV